MKSKYSISYFIFIGSTVVALVVAFAMSASIQNKYIIQEKQLQQAQVEAVPDPIVNSNSNDVVNDPVTDGYYIGIEGNHIVVYLADKTTVFEETEIDVTLLDDEVFQEIQKGKYIKSTKELYGFLENYSS